MSSARSSILDKLENSEEISLKKIAGISYRSKGSLVNICFPHLTTKADFCFHSLSKPI